MNNGPVIDARFIDNCVAGCAASHQRLLATLDAVSEAELDGWFATPTELPGWTRAHVLAHLALNAESHIHLFAEAARGVQGEQYPGGAKARAQAVVEASALTPIELVRRVRKSIYGLEAAWARSDAGAWLGTGKNVVGTVLPVADLPLFRWREVEVHTSDLGIGHTFLHWDPLYVRLDLPRMVMRYTSRSPMGMTALPPEALRLSENERLAWLMGRTTPLGLERVDGL